MERPDGYQPRTSGAAVLSEQQSAYSIAQLPGHPHHGWLKRQRSLPTVKLRKSIRSFRKLIARHEAWIEDPYLKFPRDADLEEVRYHQGVKWPSDIARHREQINILEGIIHEREE